MEAVARYRAYGGLLALDAVGETPAPSEALAAYVSWVRINVRSYDAVTIGKICDRVTLGFGKNAPKLIATQIDEVEQYEVVVGLGFDAFQGAFFSRPEPLPSANMPQSTVAAALQHAEQSGDGTKIIKYRDKLQAKEQERDALLQRLATGN